MNVIVLGAGVVGVSTAYYLAQRGCCVTVVERADDVASATSHANGGQLSYSFTESLATPGFITKIPALLLGRDIGTRIRLSPQLTRWGTRFLTQCTPKRSRANSLALLETAMRSQQLMAELRQTISFDFAFRPAGKLVLLATDDELRIAESSTALKRKHGSDVELLTESEATLVEPALATFDAPIKAAVYSRSDEVGDARQFVVGMRKHLERQQDVKFHLGMSANKLIIESGRICGVHCRESISADAVVVCLGIWSNDLLRDVGVDPHIYPVRGYSVTLPISTASPAVSITALRERFVFSRLNDKIRIAGFADFKGFDNRADDDRVRTLVDTARRVAPNAADYDCVRQHPWGGFRPMTPNGRPCVGRTKVEGLYLNTGHGMLGWTLACATGKATADAVARAH